MRRVFQLACEDEAHFGGFNLNLQQLLSERDGDGFGAVRGAELLADGVEVLVDGVGGDADLGRDGVAREAADEVFEDFRLSVAQLGRRREWYCIGEDCVVCP